MIPLQDPFWTADHAAERVAELRRAAGELQGSLELCRRLQALEHAPGFADFVSTVAVNRDAAVREMLEIGFEAGADARLRYQQGRASALNTILGIMREVSSQRSLLEGRLAEVQNALRELERRPKG